METEHKKLCEDCNQPKQLLLYMSKQPSICEQCFDNRQQSLFIPMNVIIENLYLGSLEAISSEILIKNQIKAICSCGKDMKKPEQIESYNYKNIPVGDLQEENIHMYFEQFYLWVKENIQKKQNMLIHCAAGASRSASFVISYLIKSQKLTFKDALKYVRSKRACVDPNDGFKRQLIQWQQNCNNKI